MYKIITKSSDESYDNIARRVYGSPEKAGDILKLNNNIESGEILVCAEDDSTLTENKEVTLVTDDNSYNKFPAYRLIDGLNAIKGAIFVFNKENGNFTFKIGQNVSVYDEEGLFFNGRIANIKNYKTPHENVMQLEIKSNAGILLDSVLPYPLEFSNLSVKNILSNIVQLFGQEITFSDEKELEEVFSNEIGVSFSAHLNESAFDFMNRICLSRGLLLTDTGTKLFAGRFKENTEEKINLIADECTGLAEMYRLINGDGLARFYEVNSQFPQSDTEIITIPYSVPVTKRFNSNDYNSSDLKTLGERIVCREIGKCFNLIAVLNENKLIKSGSFATVKNSDAGIDEETTFVIKKVERSHPDKTVLTMTLPCAYTFNLPDTIPDCY